MMDGKKCAKCGDDGADDECRYFDSDGRQRYDKDGKIDYWFYPDLNTDFRNVWLCGDCHWEYMVMFGRVQYDNECTLSIADDIELKWLKVPRYEQLVDEYLTLKELTKA